VVRGPRVRQIHIAPLDADRDPAHDRGAGAARTPLHRRPRRRRRWPRAPANARAQRTRLEIVATDAPRQSA